MDAILLGVDIGTASCKAAAYDAHGNRLAQETCPLIVNYPLAGWAEQNCEAYWRAFRQALRQLSRHIKDRTAIRGIAISGQAPTLILLDKMQEPLRDAIIWMDGRAIHQAQQISEKTGHYRPPTYNSPKLLWISENEPHIYEKICWIQSCSGFISSRLVGAPVIDLTDNEFFDFSRSAWNKSFLDQIHVPMEWLPAPIRTGETMGTIIGSVAHELGIPAQTPVIAAPFDGMASIHGVGLTKPGQCALVLGTSAGVGVISTTIPPESTKLFVSRHFQNWNWWLIGGVMSMGGAAYDWFREKIWSDSNAPHSENQHQLLEAAVETVPAGSSGLIFLPYLSGERSPIWDDRARGIFFGLSTQHSRKHLLRAVMEGVCYGVRDNIELMQRNSIPITEFRVTGGIGRSALWTQICADVIGKTIQIPRYLDSETLGDAMLVAVNQNLYHDHQEAATAMVQITRVVTPNLDNHDLYSCIYDIYKKLYLQNKPLFDQRYELIERQQKESSS